MKTLKNNINQKISEHSNLFVFFVGILIGAICFLSIYGFGVIKVTNVNWLMNGEDLTQHYLGWVFYRKSDWSSIIGLVENMVYPGKVSIVFTDSIPILAIFFKILSPILPETFQYFGLWGLLCFMLQGGISSLIIKKYTENKLIPIVSSILFCMSSMLLQRMFIHSALAANWIILLALLIFVNRDKLKGSGKELLLWGLLVGLVPTIHMYYVPMVFCILFFYLISNYLDDKNIKRFVFTFGMAIIICLAVMFILGGFYGTSDYSQGGLGAYSANLNTLYNTYFGALLTKQPLYISEQWEGLGYLGAGFLLLLFLSIVSIVEEYKSGESIKVKIHRHKNDIVVFLMLLVFIFFAISPVITFNDKVLFTIPYPKVILDILSIFRASGRFIWPVSYVIMIFTLRKVIKKYTAKVAAIIIILCCMIQIYDFSTFISDKRTKFTQVSSYASVLQSSVWEDIAGQYEGIVFLNIKEEKSGLNLNEQFPVRIIFDLAEYAIHNDMYLNDFHVSRSDKEQSGNNKLLYLEAIREGTVEANNIYIFAQNPYLYLKDSNLNFYYIDGIYIGLVEPLAYGYVDQGIVAIDIKMGYDISLIDKSNVKPTKSGYLFDKGGQSIGEIGFLPKGQYCIEIIGDTIRDLDIKLLYQEQEIKLKNLSKEQEVITFEFECDEDLEDVQVVISNNSNTNPLVKAVKLYEAK